MFNFFRKGPTQSQPTERAPPPPSSQARRDKEHRWFNSLKPNSAPTSHQALAHSSPNDYSSPALRSDQSIHGSPRSLRLGEGRNATSGASLRTRGSRLFQLGGSTTVQPDRYKHSSEPSHTSFSSNGYAASAPHLHAHGRRTSPPPPPPLPDHHQPSSPPPPTADPNTKSLATRLQELATSHADGLLDDEEYRLLRTELFERYAAKSSQPVQSRAEPSLTALGRLANGQHQSLLTRRKRTKADTTRNGYTASSPTLAPPLPPTMVSPPPTAKTITRAPSFVSTNSRDTRRSSVSGLRSLFRRSSHATLRPDGDGVERDAWEIVDPNSAPTSPTTAESRPPPANHHSPDLATRTVRHHPALASASLSPSMSYRSNRSSNGYGYTTRAGSSIRSGGSIRSGSGSKAGTSLSMSNGPTLLAPMASSRDPFLLAAAEREPTSKELREEIAEIERERQRLEDSWKSLEQAALAKAGGPNGHGSAQVAQAGEPTIQLRPPTADGSGATKRMSTLLRKSSFTRRPLSQVAESPTFSPSPARSPHQSSASRLGPGSRHSPIQHSPSSRAGDHSPARRISPSIASSEFASPTTSRIIVTDELNGDGDEAEDGAGMGLDDVRRRRRATDERYEKRLEFLRARLRGALLREGLKG